MKPERNVLDAKSNRLLSLLNVEHKILGKILANRLLLVAGSVVQEDQNGFVLGRNTHINLQRLFCVMDMVPREEVDAAVAFLDIEKAFNMPYLFTVLGKMGLQGGMV